MRRKFSTLRLYQLVKKLVKLTAIAALLTFFLSIYLWGSYWPAAYVREMDYCDKLYNSFFGKSDHSESLDFIKRTAIAVQNECQDKVLRWDKFFNRLPLISLWISVIPPTALFVLEKLYKFLFVEVGKTGSKMHNGSQEEDKK